MTHIFPDMFLNVDSISFLSSCNLYYLLRSKGGRAHGEAMPPPRQPPAHQHSSRNYRRSARRPSFPRLLSRPLLPRRFRSGVSGSPSRQSPRALASGTLHTGQRFFSLSCSQLNDPSVTQLKTGRAAGAGAGVEDAASGSGDGSVAFANCHHNRYQSTQRDNRQKRIGIHPGAEGAKDRREEEAPPSLQC